MISNKYNNHSSILSQKNGMQTDEANNVTSDDFASYIIANTNEESDAS